jgi:uncharacterized protein YraI
MERAGRAAELWPLIIATAGKGRPSAVIRQRAAAGWRRYQVRRKRPRQHWLRRVYEALAASRPRRAALLLPVTVVAALLIAATRPVWRDSPSATATAAIIAPPIAATLGLSTPPDASPPPPDSAEPDEAVVPGATAAVATPSPHSPAPVVTLPAAMLIVGPRGANLRQGPGAAYAVVATLRAGATLEIRAVSLTGEWVQVRYPGKGSPWIDARYAVLSGGVGGIPVATAAGPTTVAQAATPTTGYAPPAAWPTTPSRPPQGPLPNPTRTPAAPPTPLPSPTAPPP